MTDSYKGRGKLRPAGMLFGLDLSEFFEDDEGKSSGGMQGFQPITKTTTFNKGRTPTTLTYKAPSQAANITEVIGSAMAAPVETPEAPEPEFNLVDDYLKNFSKYDVGEQGLFGGKDVDYLRGQGVSDEDIRGIAQQRSSVQPLPAAVYQRLGGVTAAEQSTPDSPGAQTAAQNYLSGSVDVGEKGIFGGQDVRALLGQGMSKNEVIATAKAIRNAGQTLPNAVFRELGQF
jgi:hypothetical protein